MHHVKVKDNDLKQCRAVTVTTIQPETVFIVHAIIIVAYPMFKKLWLKNQ